MAPEVALPTLDRYDTKRADIWSCGMLLYTLLCGRYPFNNYKVCRAEHSKVDWKVPDGVELSPECLDLLDRMLVRDPAQRLTMEGVLGHPWFLNNLPEKVRTLQHMQKAQRPALRTYLPAQRQHQHLQGGSSTPGHHYSRCTSVGWPPWGVVMVGTPAHAHKSRLGSQNGATTAAI
jgi:serine/threonine protein kinase